MNADETISEKERIERWRLILGKDAEGALGGLASERAKMDDVLQALYGGSRSGLGGGFRGASLSGSAPKVNRWLGDIRTYFPRSVVSLMQKDALERLNLKALLLEPEILETIEVDVDLVAALISLSSVIPASAKETARSVVRKLVDDVTKRIRAKTVSCVEGSVRSLARTMRPKPNDIDFLRTIQANLRNKIPGKDTIVVDRLVGLGRARSALCDVILCVDESGSMSNSVVYSSIFGATLASLPALSTRLVFFDTSVVDMTEKISDPVDVLFGAQLGGGTNIANALAYCRSKMQTPNKTILFLITDLYEGGSMKRMLSLTYELVSSGVNLICLTALSDDGNPCYDAQTAGVLSSMGVPTFACTPDLFPELIAVAINQGDVARWTTENNVKLATAVNCDASPLHELNFI